MIINKCASVRKRSGNRFKYQEWMNCFQIQIWCMKGRKTSVLDLKATNSGRSPSGFFWSRAEFMVPSITTSRSSDGWRRGRPRPSHYRRRVWLEVSSSTLLRRFYGSMYFFQKVSLLSLQSTRYFFKITIFKNPLLLCNSAPLKTNVNALTIRS